MKKYKKFVIGFLSLVPIIFILYLSSIYFLYFDSRNDSFSIKIYSDYKNRYANSIDGRKLLFVSGSSNFLGIRTSKIEEYFNIPTVNMGIHAGLRSEYILYQAKKVLKKGDVVIVLFDYENLIYNGEPSIVKNQYILTYDRDYFNNLDFISQLKTLSSISLYDLAFSANDKFETHYTDNQKNNFLKNLNKNGDMLGREKHYELKTKKPLLKLPNPITLETKGLIEMVKFRDWCKDNGIKLYVSYPNMIYRDEYKNRKEYQEYFTFTDNYFKSHNIQTIGTPFDAMYPRKYFHDNQYHLTSKSSDIRTEDFIKLSKDILTKEINNTK
jgi:hypothetical protein